LPGNCDTVYANGRGIADCGGIFYSRSSDGYQVAPPPFGATVPNLPPGAKSQTYGDRIYFQSGGVYYSPVYQGSAVAYRIVPQPG
jgi:hypothetical protein